MPPLPFDVLKKRLQGELYNDRLNRFMLATDGSIFQKQPCAVAYPKDTRDVVDIVRFADTHGLSVHARGAGSGLCGAALGAGIVVDFTRHMNHLIDLDTRQGQFVCQPGYRLGELEAALKGSGCFFPPDPSSGEYATLGGMYGTNASGAHSVKYGNVADYIMDAEIVLANGRVVRLSRIEGYSSESLPEPFSQLHQLYKSHRAAIEGAYPDIACNVAGYNLRGLVQNGRLRLHNLLAGAEGTLGVVTRLWGRLIPKPAADSLVVAYFDHILKSGRAVQQILSLGPAGIEIMDKSLLDLARSSNAALDEIIPRGTHNVLLIEFDGADAAACTGQAEAVRTLLVDQQLCLASQIAVNEQQKQDLWAVRKAAVPILYRLKGTKKILALIEDAAVPVPQLQAYFEGLYHILERQGVDFVIYGHIAKGLLHTRPLLDLKTVADVSLLKPLAEAVYDLVSGLGGTVSGEHGDGRLRSAYVKRRYPEIYPLFQQTKTLLDPHQRLNPEIITRHDPQQVQQDLRYGSAYRARVGQRLQLAWPEGYPQEIEKCHGCSKCTTVTTATRMCPVFKFTRREAAAPKAKANLLRGLISGAIEDQTVYEDLFQQIMAYCANCGSCARECPSHVNIPKMAMEAKATYVKRFGAGLENQLLSSIEWVGRRFGRLMPLARPFENLSLPRQLLEKTAGLAAQRPMIQFSPRPLAPRKIVSGADGRPRVLYFAGCYARYVRPQIGRAAQQVLERMGMQVYLPEQFCCGLPMLSKGMVDQARGKVGDNLKHWRRLLNDVDVITVTCSSCGYALMSDWGYLAQGQLIAEISRKTTHISRLINQHQDRLKLRGLPHHAGYHAPCHLKIQPDPGCSMEMLSRIPDLHVTDLNSHCCGMIGSWGMAAKNYELSREIGQPMLTALEQIHPDYGITDCPTCRMQMEDLGGVVVKHPVEVLAESLTKN